MTRIPELAQWQRRALERQTKGTNGRRKSRSSGRTRTRAASEVEMPPLSQPAAQDETPAAWFYVSDRLEKTVLGDQKNPLLHWSLYAGVLLALSGVAAGRYLFTAVGSDGTGLSLFIVLLFLAALIKNLADIVFIHRQTVLTGDQMRSLMSSPQVSLFLMKVRASLFRDHVRNLYEIARRDQQLSQDNLVTLLQARLVSRTRLVEVASGLLVTLGFVGTIVGLISAVGGLGVVANAVGENNAELLEGLKGTFSGMGTAFYTTLIGAVLGGVVLRVLSSVTDSHADGLVTSIAELSEVYIVPSLRRSARIVAESSVS